LLITRDFTTVAFVVQIVIALLGLIVWAADRSRARDALFPSSWSPLSVDYVSGLLCLLFLLGVYGVLMGLWWCCCPNKSTAPVTYDTYPYSFGYYYIWFGPLPGSNANCCPFCDCGGGAACCPGCDCNNSGSDNGSLLAFLGIVAIVVIVIGALVGIVLLTVVGSRIVHRHIHVVKKLEEANNVEVVDQDQDQQ